MAGAADPDVDAIDGSDGAGLEEFDDAAVVGFGVDLGAHLSGDFGIGGGGGDEAGLMDGVGKGFFAVDVFFELECGKGGWGVGVVWGSDEDGVDVVVDFVEHGAEVGEGFCGGEFGGGFGEDAFVDVAEGDDGL